MPSPDDRTLGGVLRSAAARLEAAGFTPADARVDARLLARHAFRLDEAALIVRELDAPPTDGFARFVGLVARRASHEPVAYILGSREFYGREFEVTPAVLIPRPETELIVELALARFPDRRAPLEIVDVGTGSGCLAVTLALEFEATLVVATDVSAGALEVARRNARRHGVAHRVAFHQVSLVAGVDQVDLVVSNPPYIPVGQRQTLPSDVRDFEPHLALFSGADGLGVIRSLVRHVADAGVLARGTGWLLFEVGVGQADAVRRLLHEDGRYEDISLADDLQGIPRTACARRA
jgi:release factor glutamine methyltransferase